MQACWVSLRLLSVLELDWGRGRRGGEGAGVMGLGLGWGELCIVLCADLAVFSIFWCFVTFGV